MKVRYLLLAANLLGACATSDALGTQLDKGGAQSLTEIQAAHLEGMVEEFATSQRFPNLAVGVVRGSDRVWQVGHGAGGGSGETPDAETVFRIGSITKVINATAVLALVEDGTLSLDDEAADWLPELEGILSPPTGPAITLRHLISHSSGLPGGGNGRVDWTRPGANIMEADLLASLDGVEPAFVPGTRHEYSNLGTALAGLVVSRASGQSYRSFVQERVLDPLGMSDSTWDPPAGRLAPGHRTSPLGGYQRAGASWRLGAMEPAGGLYSTVADLAHLASFGLGHSSILQAETLALSQTEVNDLSGFGLGWLVTPLPEIGKLAWHNGSTGDYGAYIAVIPEHDVGVVLLMGSGAMGDVAELASLGRAILAYLLDPETDVAPEPSTTAPAAIAAVADRLLALMSTPTLAGIEEAFDPAFFFSVPKDDLLTFFANGAAATGGCSSHELLDDRGAGSFLLHLGCERSGLVAEVVASTSAPYPMLGLTITPR